MRYQQEVTKVAHHRRVSIAKLSNCKYIAILNERVLAIDNDFTFRAPRQFKTMNEVRAHIDQYIGGGMELVSPNLAEEVRRGDEWAVVKDPLADDICRRKVPKPFGIGKWWTRCGDKAQVFYVDKWGLFGITFNATYTRSTNWDASGGNHDNSDLSLHKQREEQ